MKDNYEICDMNCDIVSDIIYNLCDTIGDERCDEMCTCIFCRCESFHLPSSHSQDIIMIGAGSGLAPFRSFWQHKQYLAAHPSSDADSLRFSQGGGMFYLFQGFRSRSQALHRSELNDIVADRTIEARFTAFSREKHITKVSLTHIVVSA